MTTTDPLNRTTTLTYDAAGNVPTSTDALSRTTTLEYDAMNRLKTVADPAGGITAYTYDGNGNLLAVKDAKNQVTTFSYDARNRLVSTTDPLGKVETYEYDATDNLTKRITPKLDQIVFAYSGIRPLPASDASNPGLISRDHSAPVAEPGEGRPFPVISLVGGKWTTFRGFAEEVADTILTRLGRSRTVSTQMLPMWAFTTGIQSGDLGAGAAIALYLLPILAVVTVLMLLAARRVEVS